MTRRIQSSFMLAALALVLVLVCIFSCSKKGKTAQSPSKTYAFVPETEGGLEESRKNLESTVLENYTQLTYNNIEALLDSVVLDREIHLVGVTPKDLVIGIKPPALSKDRRLYSQRNPKILSKNLDVYLSEDGSVAWVYDEISYRVQYMNREASIPIRATAVFIRDVGRWLMVSEHRSYGIPSEELVELAAAGKLVTGRKIEDDYGDSAPQSAKLLSIIGRFINTGEGMKETEDSLVILHGPRQEFHGATPARTLSLAKGFGPNATVALREFRVQVASNTRVAWVVANLVVNSNVNGLPIAIPMRGTFVLEKRRDETWAIVQVHISVAMLERQISNWVFEPLASDI